MTSLDGFVVVSVGAPRLSITGSDVTLISVPISPDSCCFRKSIDLFLNMHPLMLFRDILVRAFMEYSFSKIFIPITMNHSIKFKTFGTLEKINNSIDPARVVH